MGNVVYGKLPDLLIMCEKIEVSGWTV